MTTVVIMPGGFHPFHAGHLALYQSAQRTFPDAEVFVAATNDTSARPFPFAVKEKLAKLAGVDAGHFVQVKSPFRAEEITSKFDPAKDTLIFVRSDKDSTKPPQAGGIKKDGNPAYLQPLLGAKKLEPFSKHAYMAYLPTVEFGPGMTSATEIRGAWPTLNDKRKTALVMSLYPKTQTNPKLAATVVKLLDTAIGSEQGVAEGSLNEDWTQLVAYGIMGLIFGPDIIHWFKRATDKKVFKVFINGKDVSSKILNKEEAIAVINSLAKQEHDTKTQYAVVDTRTNNIVLRKTWSDAETDYHRRGWVDSNESVEQGVAEVINPMTANTSGAGAGMTASYQARENQPVAERHIQDYMEEARS